MSSGNTGKEEGLFVGLSARAKALASLELARNSGRGGNIVTILPDTGTSYLSLS